MNFIKTNLSFFHYILLFASFSFVPLGAFEVQNIPVQSEGRIKPLDTFARNMLLRFYGKREIKDQNIKASDWLLDLILDPENGRNIKVFNIRNPEVVSRLFLEWSTQHKYSFNEISILDLFAGSGNISYEFYSRGVKDVLAVDNNLDSLLSLVYFKAILITS